MSDTLRLDASRPADVTRAVEFLAGGGLVAFPTETVYGLGALGLDAAAAARIFAAKGRPRTDPLILHLAGADWLPRVARDVPPAAGALAAAFWPGPLTLVLPRGPDVPDVVTAGLGTVAARVPAHPVALDLIARVGAPVAAPSANRFSRPSPTTAAHVLQDLDGRIAAVLDGGPTSLGVESTVLDLTREPPVVLRPGGVTREALEAVLGLTLGRPAADGVGEGAPQVSPGLLTRHYSPRAEVLLFAGNPGAVRPALRAAGRAGAAVLAYTEDLPDLADLPDVTELGPRSEPAAVARSLYAALRDADERGAARVAVALLPEGGVGEAVNDRLRRAAAGLLIRLS